MATDSTDMYDPRETRQKEMDRLRLIAAIGITLVATGTARAQSPAAQGDPVALVRELMADYAADNTQDLPYTPAITIRLRRAQLDVDCILDAQDVDVKNVTVAGVSAAADRAEVEARFLSFDRPRQVRFDFRVIDGRWMIANVRDQKGCDLRRMLRLPTLQ